MASASRPTFTVGELTAMYDALIHLTGYAGDELREHLDWGDTEMGAYESALGKLALWQSARGSVVQ